MRIRLVAAAAAILGWIGSGQASNAARAAEPVGPHNPFNDELLKMTPPQRAAKLAEEVGNWCIGTKAFFMGVNHRPPRPGSVYWSLKCANGGSYVIEIDVDGKGAAIDCPTFKEAAPGRACFKKF